MKNIFVTVRKTLTAAVIATIAMGFTTAWAAGTHEHGHGDPFGEPGNADDVTRTIEVNLYDNYYEPEEIDITSGETIRFKLINRGDFVHEFNIGTPDMHANHQEEMMMMVEHGVLEPDKINYNMMEMDMGGGHMMSHDDPNTMLLEPGDVAEVIWKFGDATTLEFACNIPGHYDSGMAGLFRFAE